jgi:hypothetical protein
MLRLARVAFLASFTTLAAVAASCSSSSPSGDAPEGADGSVLSDASPGPGSDAALDAGGGPEDAAGDADADAGTGAIDVSGKLFSLGFDLALAGATVQVAGGAQVATSDGGTFSFSAITPPYTLITSHTGSTPLTVDVFEGLTTSAPVLESSRYDTGPAAYATIQGAVLGVTSPLPAETVVRVFARSTGNGIAPMNLAAGDLATYSIQPNWKGTTSRSIVVRAIAYRSTGGYPTTFSGYGETTVVANDNDTLTGIDVTLNTPATKIVTGTFNPSSYSGTVYSDVFWLPRDTIGGEYAWAMPAQSPYSIEVPDLPGATLRVGFNDGGSGELRKIPASNTLDFTVSAGATLASPVADATFAPGMTFSWTAPAGATGIYRFSMEAKNTDPSLYVWTKATSIVVPAVFVPTSGQTYTWTVWHYATVPSVDTIAAGDPRPTRYYSTSRNVNVP